MIAYWFTSASIASMAACFTNAGAGKSGKPCARLMASCSNASRVISRMTDSENTAVREAAKGRGDIRAILRTARERAQTSRSRSTTTGIARSVRASCPA